MAYPFRFPDITNNWTYSIPENQITPATFPNWRTRTYGPFKAQAQLWTNSHCYYSPEVTFIIGSDCQSFNESSSKDYNVSYYYMTNHDAITLSGESGNLTDAYNEAKINLATTSHTALTVEPIFFTNNQYNPFELVQWGMSHFYNANETTNGYLCSIDTLYGISGSALGGVNGGTVAGITLFSSNINFCTSTKTCFSFILDGNIVRNPYLQPSQNRIRIISCIHELGHQIIINNHSDHNSCCVMNCPWPGSYGQNNCSNFNYHFCDFHKCILYHSNF